jgi:hypothetical protein
MRWHSGIILSIFMAGLAVPAMAQNDICAQGTQKETSDQARAEQLRLQAADQAVRQSWAIRMFTVKNLEYRNNYSALCIFKIEVVLQQQLKMVQVRAPKEMLPAIEEAIKTLDVPPPPSVPPSPQKNVEITAYILMSGQDVDPKWMPLPSELEGVAGQVKNILGNEKLYLADTAIARGLDGSRIVLNGSTTFEAWPSVQEGNPIIVKLRNISVQSNGGGFTSSVDVPVGAKVVVGKANGTVQLPGKAPSKGAVILVLTAKVF